MAAIPTAVFDTKSARITSIISCYWHYHIFGESNGLLSRRRESDSNSPRPAFGWMPSSLTLMKHYFIIFRCKYSVAAIGFFFRERAGLLSASEWFSAVLSSYRLILPSKGSNSCQRLKSNTQCSPKVQRIIILRWQWSVCWNWSAFPSPLEVRRKFLFDLSHLMALFTQECHWLEVAFIKSYTHPSLFGLRSFHALSWQKLWQNSNGFRSPWSLWVSPSVLWEALNQR